MNAATIPLDAIALLLTGLAVLTIALQQLLLWRAFRQPLMLRWALALSLLAATDLLQIATWISTSAAAGRLLAIGGNITAILMLASFFGALVESGGTRFRHDRLLFAGAALVGGAFVVVLVLTEPSTLAADPAHWYRAGWNPFVRVFYSLGVLVNAGVAWRAVRRNPGQPGQLVLFAGLVIAIARPTIVGVLVGAAGGSGVSLASSALLITLIGDVLLIGVGTLLVVLQFERLRAVAATKRIERTERIERLGLMAGGIAHDMNNMLTAVSLSLDLARDPGATPSEREETFIAMEGAVDHGRSMTRRLLAFAKGERSAPQEFRIAPWMRAQGGSWRHAMGGPHEVELRIDLGDDVRVLIDASRLQQVMLNTLLNSRDAAPAGRTAHAVVAVGLVETRRERTVGFSRIHPGRWVVLRISDDGPGFSAAALDRVFEPLFTTKGAAGTGLGLATVFTALREAEGAVSASNAPEGGAVVECWLPVHGPAD